MMVEFWFKLIILVWFNLLGTNAIPCACETEECKMTAERILSSLNMSANPCDNFYQYACGGWITNNPLPPGASNNEVLGQMQGRIDVLMQDILATDYLGDREALRKTKQYFKACVNESVIEELEAKPALDLIEDLGGMPLFGGGVNESSFVLESYLAMAKRRTESPPAGIEILQDLFNNSINRIAISEPNLIMPAAILYLDSFYGFIQQAYLMYLYDYLGEIWKSLDEELNQTTYNETELTQAVEELNSSTNDRYVWLIFQLETALASIVSEQSSQYYELTLDEMFFYSGFDWTAYVNELFSLVGITVPSTTTVFMFFGLDYLFELKMVLERFSSRVIQNYIITYQLHLHLPLLSQRFRDTDDNYRLPLYGNNGDFARQDDCTSKTAELFPFQFGALFVQAAFPVEERNMMIEMVEYIRQALRHELMVAEWLDSSTRERALIKLDAILSLMGYPDYIVEESNPQLDDEYEELFISELEYFTSEHNTYFHAMIQSLMEYGQTSSRENWFIGPAVVNAFYSPVFNIIAFPAAIIQPPMFSSKQPLALNYGAIGNVVGHEFSHGFDNTGSLFDENGNFQNWWTPESRANFEERSRCLSEQYSQYFSEDLGEFLNGEGALGENIADNGGIRMAYLGYRLWRQRNRELEFQLPGMERFTSDQLFFLNMAQTWCVTELRSSTETKVAGGYSPNEFRVIGPTRNFDKFGQAFHCTRGVDFQYPAEEDVCRVW